MSAKPQRVWRRVAPGHYATFVKQVVTTRMGFESVVELEDLVVTKNEHYSFWNDDRTKIWPDEKLWCAKPPKGERRFFDTVLEAKLWLESLP